MAANSGKNKSPKEYQKLSGSERPRSSAAKSKGPLDPDTPVSVTLVLRHRPGSPPLPDAQHWQNTPIGRRQFLSPLQFADTYGASQDDLAAVTSFVTSHGMTVLNSHPGRRTVSISGTAAQMNAAFGIQLNLYDISTPQASFSHGRQPYRKISSYHAHPPRLRRPHQHPHRSRRKLSTSAAASLSVPLPAILPTIPTNS